MKVSVRLADQTWTEYDADTAMAASKAIPFWTIWEKVDETGNQRVHFFNHSQVIHVKMYGPPEEDDKKATLAEVVPLRGGDE